MGKKSARGRSPVPPSPAEKLPAPAPFPAATTPTLAVPGTLPATTKPRSKSRSRSRSKSNRKAKKDRTVDTSYKSEGVNDNDVFLLPGSDYITAIGLTIAATIVRLYKIYQPTSVVFDEVQYVVNVFIIPELH